MKVVFIGADTRTAEIASLGVRLRWPDSTVIQAVTATQGMEQVEREWPDIVLLHSDFSDMTHSGAIQELRGFSNVPLLVLVLSQHYFGSPALLVMHRGKARQLPERG